MQIRAGTPLAYLMFYWPFIMSGIVTLLYFSTINLGRLVVLFVIGVLVGYGVSMFLMMPITASLTRIISQNIPHDKVSDATFWIHYLGSFLLTGIFLWVLGWSLSSKA